MNGNFKIKYIGDGSNRYFTYNKIYEIKDGVLILDNGTSLTNIQNFSSICYNINATFEEIKEKGENKMEDLRELIKPCYLLVLEDGKKVKTIETQDGIAIQYDGISMSGWDNLSCVISRVKEVYGLCRYGAKQGEFSEEYRELIWKRTEISPTQLKLEELEKKQREIADEMEKLRKEL